MAGYLPFHDSNLMEMYRKIGKAEFKCPGWFPSDVRKLLSRILDPNPATRISMAKILENPWVRKGFDDKVLKNEAETKEIVPVDVNAVFESPDITVDVNKDVVKPSNLNAFDIISLSSGFDLSGLFEEKDRKREARFTSTKPASAIISKLEEIAKRLRFKVKKREGGVLKMEGAKEGRKGVLALDAEIFEVTPNFHLVEIKKMNGDTLEYQKMWKQEMRPALKDIVWAWQGDQPQSLPALPPPPPPPSQPHQLERAESRQSFEEASVFK